MRIDGSAAMLNKQPNGVQTLRHDLSRGLPDWSEPPQLLASSFVLHWLPDPAQQLRGWVDALPEGGWLALAVPVDGSFPQWQQAARNAGQVCTALTMPVREQLMAALPGWRGATGGVPELHPTRRQSTAAAATDEQHWGFRHQRRPALPRPVEGRVPGLAPGRSSPGFALTWRMWVLMVKR